MCVCVCVFDDKRKNLLCIRVYVFVCHLKNIETFFPHINKKKSSQIFLMYQKKKSGNSKNLPLCIPLLSNIYAY